MEDSANNKLNSSPGRKVLGEISNSRSTEGGNPLSPTANLKLLTKVASNLIEQPEIGLTYFSSDVKKINKEFPLHYIQNQSDENSKSRKDKSLSLLCNKFLALFPMKITPGDQMMISLDQAAMKLGTERRRIYDIINVLESLQMAAKVGKNRYVWYGEQQLHYTLAQLKGLAERLGLREQVQLAQQKQKLSYVRVVADLSDSELQVMQPGELTQQTQGLLSLPTQQTDNSSLLEGCTERSLGVMCQKFIMLFLVSDRSEYINLEMAASILISESESDSRAGRFKTKVRRLYDIANVLTSLGLISKVPSSDNSLRKPAFRYMGPDIIAAVLSDEDVQLFQATRHSLLGTSPCLRPLSASGESRKRKLSEELKCREDSGSLDDILHVAEMELKRLESLETTRSARKKLFTRHHSEPCISTTRKLVKVAGLGPSVPSIAAAPAPTHSSAIRVHPLPLVLTQPAVVLASPTSTGGTYRVMRLASVVHLLPATSNPVK